MMPAAMLTILFDERFFSVPVAATLPVAATFPVEPAFAGKDTFAVLRF